MVDVVFRPTQAYLVYKDGCTSLTIQAYRQRELSHHQSIYTTPLIPNNILYIYQLQAATHVHRMAGHATPIGENFIGLTQQYP